MSKFIAEATLDPNIKVQTVRCLQNLLTHHMKSETGAPWTTFELLFFLIDNKQSSEF